MTSQLLKLVPALVVLKANRPPHRSTDIQSYCQQSLRIISTIKAGYIGCSSVHLIIDSSFITLCKIKVQGGCLPDHSGNSFFSIKTLLSYKNWRSGKPVTESCVFMWLCTQAFLSFSSGMHLWLPLPYFYFKKYNNRYWGEKKSIIFQWTFNDLPSY